MTELYDREFSEQYDEMLRARNWTGPDIVFGLMYEYIKPGESLLDMGIGTGAGSLLFHKAGLKIYGTDNAAEMLKVCEKKGFVSDLKCHDLSVLPYPYPDSAFHYAVSVGTFDHFRELDPVFREIPRILIKGGIFGFIVGDRKEGQSGEYLRSMGVKLYRQSESHIRELLDHNGFMLKKLVEFEWRKEYLKAYIAEKQS